jgi:hypothetical protein
MCCWMCGSFLLRTAQTKRIAFQRRHPKLACLKQHGDIVSRSSRLRKEANRYLAIFFVVGSLAGAASSCSSETPSSAANSSLADSTAPTELLEVASSSVLEPVADTAPWVPDYLKQDLDTVKAVVRATLGERKVVDRINPNSSDANCGYARVVADATVLEVFKGPLVSGQTTVVEWVIECPVEPAKLFEGERLLFLDPVTENKTATSPDWVALENSTLPATDPILTELRRVIATK